MRINVKRPRKEKPRPSHRGDNDMPGLLLQNSDATKHQRHKLSRFAFLLGCYLCGEADARRADDAALLHR
jgi:hypothetical protein